MSTVREHLASAHAALTGICLRLLDVSDADLEDICDHEEAERLGYLSVSLLEDFHEAQQ